MTTDLLCAHQYAVLALLHASQCTQDRLPPEQLAQMQKLLADGTGRLALFVTKNGEQVHVELAVIPNDKGTFDNALLRLDGSVLSPAAAPDQVSLVDRAGMN